MVKIIVHQTNNMKYIITERQLNLIKESEEKVLYIPTFELFNDDWELLQQFLNKKGNPPYSIGGNLDLSNTNIKSLGNLTSVSGNLDLYETKIKTLGNLTSVGGYLDLRYSSIESLGNLTSVGDSLYLNNSEIESLGNLTSVGGNLYLSYTPIKSLENLTSVGGNLDLRKTPLSKKYSEKEIRQMVNVGSEIYL